MGTAIVAHGNPTPILDPTKHDLSVVALFVESCAVAALGRSVLPRRNAWDDTLLFTGGNEPIRIIAAVGDQMFGIGKAGQQASRTGVIACVPGC